MKIYYNNWQFIKHATMLFMLGLSGGVAITNSSYWLFVISITFSLLLIWAPPEIKSVGYWKKLESCETLFEASAFKMTLTSFLILASLYLIIDLYSENGNVHENIYNHLKKPAIIFSLSIPLIALIANHHRSIQTYKQISNSQKSITISEGQNIFTNFIKHKELFLENFEKKAFKETPFITTDPNALYMNMYSDAKNGILETSEEYNKKIENLRHYISDTYAEITKNNYTWDLNNEEIAGRMLKIKIKSDEDLRTLITTPNTDFDLREECISFVEKFLRLALALHSCANFVLESESNHDMLLIIGYTKELKLRLELI